MNKIFYKIVDYKNGKYKTLFHGINKNKTLETNKWLKAEIKEVFDGTNGTRYMSGWHIIPSKEECEEYLLKFKNSKEKKIIKCMVRNIWPKEHSRSNIFLSEYLYIIED